jgi:hypothetical protein
MPRIALHTQERRTERVSLALTPLEFKAVHWAGRKAKLDRRPLILREKSVSECVQEYLDRKKAA